MSSYRRYILGLVWELILAIIFLALLSLAVASCAHKVERSEPVVVQQEKCK